VGDWYLNTTNGDVYEKTGTSAWTLVGNIKGTPGEKWYSGATVPAGATGAVGDWYLNTSTGDVYEKTGASVWTLIANIKGPQGIQGIQGPQGIQGVKGDTGNPTTPHHAMHEPGGTDQIVRLDLTGAYPQLRLTSPAGGVPGISFVETSAAVDAKKWALYAFASNFRLETITDADAGATTLLVIDRVGKAIFKGTVTTPGARIENSPGAPTLVFKEVSMAADAKVWRVYGWQTNLTFDTVNDAEDTVMSMPLVLRRDGVVQVSLRLTLGGTGTANPGWRPGAGVGGYPAAFEAVDGPGGNWSTVRAANFVSVATSNSLADLTCGATNFTAGVAVSGGSITCQGSTIANVITSASNMHCGGNFHTTAGYVYPGRIDAAGMIQSAWLIAGHGSYGLYINTGLYLVGGLWTENVSSRGLVSCTDILCSSLNTQGGAANLGPTTFAGAAWHYSSDGWQRLHFGWGGPTYIKGAGIVFRDTTTGLNDADVGSFTAGTGLFNAPSGILSLGYRCRTGIYGTSSGSWYNFNWTGAVQCWIDATHIGDVAFTSDARIKRDFTPLVNSLDKVLQMRPGTYYYLPVNEGAEADPNLHLGLLAQDVLPIAPEVVHNTGMVTPLTPDGVLRVSYLEMVPMLVAAIQELNQRVTMLSKGE